MMTDLYKFWKGFLEWILSEFRGGFNCIFFVKLKSLLINHGSSFGSQIKHFPEENIVTFSQNQDL